MEQRLTPPLDHVGPQPAIGPVGTRIAPTRTLNVLLYLPEQMADWEVGYATAELATGRFLRPGVEVRLRTAGITSEPITTMGGMTIEPEMGIEEVPEDMIGLLILPGAESWGEAGEHDAVLALAARLKVRGVPVAAICGAAEALAGAALLNDVAHTGNDLSQIQDLPSYAGHALYRQDLAVSDGAIITAGSWAPVEFAYQIFKSLDLMTETSLENWLRFWGGRDVRGIFGLAAEQRAALSVDA